MLTFVRAGIAAALVVLLPLLAAGPAAAEKAFQRDDLADAAIKLEAKIKSDAGPVSKPLATLRREADTAFGRNDVRTGLQVLGQITVVAPNDGTNWLRLAKAVLQQRSANSEERAALLERAATAAYIAYQRTGNPAEEAESLLVMAHSFADRNLWRPALDAMRSSLELREVADVRQQYEHMRTDHGFRLLDYSVDSDAASPRACFQFSEDLPGRRTDFSPFVTVAGEDKPALSVDERQICVEGLRHGERYTVTMRAGIPSVVKETLTKTAEFNIYVRDRKPFVRFADKAYVLPRTGQRGIPVVSVNTDGVSIEIYRIGDRNLLATVLGSDFQTNLDHFDFERLAQEQGAQVWKGSMKVEPTLNADVVTAFPITDAIGSLAPGVHVMHAGAAGVSDDDNEGATQWFIVSDLGLTAYSGNDGVHAFVHSLETARGEGEVEIRLIARNNEILATKRTNQAGYVQFEAALTRGEGGQSPAMIVASDPKGDYAFLSLKTPAFDLSDRGVSGRAVAAGLDAFVYTERGVYRSGETVQVTALLRDGQATAALGVPLTLVVERPDGVEYRRSVVGDQGVGRACARCAAGGLGSDRHLAGARLHGSQAPAGGRSELHGRRLCAGSARVRSRLARQERFQDHSGRDHAHGPLSLWRAHLGAVARRRGRDLGSHRTRRVRRLSVRTVRRGSGGDPPAARGSSGHGRDRKGEIQGHDRQGAEHDPPAGGAGPGTHGGGRRPRGRAQADPAGHARERHDRDQAAVRRPLPVGRPERELRRDHGRARRQAHGGAWVALRVAQGRVEVSVVSP
jgi:hypothetical protein